MAIALVAHTNLIPASNDGGTTSPIDTTGANVIFVTLTFSTSYVGPPVVSDSKGNALPLTAGDFDGSAACWLYLYRYPNPIVGTGHTFTVTGTDSYSSLCVEAFSGVDNGGSIQVSSFGKSTSGSVQPGSVTPAVNGCLIYTAAIVSGDTTGLRVFSINSGMTIADQVPYTSGVYFGCMGAYVIQGAAAAIQPTITYPGTVGGMAALTNTLQPATSNTGSSRGYVYG